MHFLICKCIIFVKPLLRLLINKNIELIKNDYSLLESLFSNHLTCILYLVTQNLSSKYMRTSKLWKKLIVDWENAVLVIAKVMDLISSGILLATVSNYLSYFG